MLIPKGNSGYKGGGTQILVSVVKRGEQTTDGQKTTCEPLGVSAAKGLVSPLLRLDGVLPSQDGVKSRELRAAALYDALPAACPEQPAVVPGDAFPAADAHQEEGEDAGPSLSHQTWH